MFERRQLVISLATGALGRVLNVKGYNEGTELIYVQWLQRGRGSGKWWYATAFAPWIPPSSMDEP